jgi:ComF family protein
METRAARIVGGAAGAGPGPGAGAVRAVGVVAAAVLDLLLPPRCPGCGREGTVLCAACAAELDARLGLPPGMPVGLPSHVPLPLVAHEWCVSYAGLGRAAIHALKYDGERRLAEPLGAALARRWIACGAGGDVLVPVPVHRDRLRERGFDQARLIAVAVGRAGGVPVSDALVRRRSTVRQAELDRSGRAGNMSGAFEAGAAGAADVRGRWAVLVDDVMTTGATIREAALALHAAGAVAVSALTVARER